MKRTVIIHSGGMDSTVLLAHLVAAGKRTRFPSITASAIAANSSPPPRSAPITRSRTASRTFAA
jgi:PP-loop superfamily ATP-utilizing enzyme